MAHETYFHINRVEGINLVPRHTDSLIGYESLMWRRNAKGMLREQHLLWVSYRVTCIYILAWDAGGFILIPNKINNFRLYWTRHNSSGTSLKICFNADHFSWLKFIFYMQLMDFFFFFFYCGQTSTIFHFRSPFLTQNLRTFKRQMLQSCLHHWEVCTVMLNNNYHIIYVYMNNVVIHSKKWKYRYQSFPWGAAEYHIGLGQGWYRKGPHSSVRTTVAGTVNKLWFYS